MKIAGPLGSRPLVKGDKPTDQGYVMGHNIIPPMMDTVVSPGLDVSCLEYHLVKAIATWLVAVQHLYGGLPSPSALSPRGVLPLVQWQSSVCSGFGYVGVVSYLLDFDLGTEVRPTTRGHRE